MPVTGVGSVILVTFVTFLGRALKLICDEFQTETLELTPSR
jgi:hypothetical protein